MLEEGKKPPSSRVGSNEKEIRFWGFPKRQRSVSLELVKFGSLAPAAMLSSGCGALELRERKKERAVSRWWCGEREQRWRETFDFAKGKKVFRRGLKIFRGIFVFSGVKGIVCLHVIFRQMLFYYWA